MAPERRRAARAAWGASAEGRTQPTPEPTALDLLLGAVSMAVIVAFYVAIYVYFFYNVSDPPGTESDGQSTARNVSLIGFVPFFVGFLLYPIRVALAHAYIPFIPVTYVLYKLFSLAYPLLLLLRLGFYIVTSPLRLLLALANLLYPLYIFFGVATLVGLVVGGSFAVIARLIWFLSDAQS